MKVLSTYLRSYHYEKIIYLNTSEHEVDVRDNVMFGCKVLSVDIIMK